MLLVIAFLEKVNYGGSFSPQGIFLVYINYQNFSGTDLKKFDKDIILPVTP
jgi:hypothetical protein